MSACDDCAIEEKLMQCCGRYPQTGETNALELPDGRTVRACPNLSPQGLCARYEARPQGCREFFCYAFQTESRRLFTRR